MFNFQDGVKFPPRFLDVFAGAGGLSLGLLKARWRGVAAIEKSSMAFETLQHNLLRTPETSAVEIVPDLGGQRYFDWPDWLPAQAHDIESFISTYREPLAELCGLPLLAGGPPCQGFSGAGKRRADDSRNRLFERYLELVELLEPKMLLLENVRGFATSFSKTERGPNGIEVGDVPFNADYALQQRLAELGYRSFVRRALKAKEFGVPQLRPRYILIAIRETFLAKIPDLDPFVVLDSLRDSFLESHGLPTSSDITLAEAVSDLLMEHGTVPWSEAGRLKFKQGVYGPLVSSYQTLLRRKRDGTHFPVGAQADSHRFPNHSLKTVARFERISREFRVGTQLNEQELRQLGTNKHRIAPLAAGKPCHTLTSLPDDMIHYCEARVLTVREYARIQSFPDWFEFRASYTSGGARRRVQIPRYTQVANAVPPLLAEALGQTLLTVYEALSQNNQPVKEFAPALLTGSDFFYSPA